MNNKKTEKITIKDVKIVGGDFFEDRAKYLATHPKKLKAYIKAVNEVYRQTGDPEILTTALEMLAMVKGNIKQQAKKANMQRSTIYRMFKKGANPTLANIAKFTYSSGIYLQLAL